MTAPPRGQETAPVDDAWVRMAVIHTLIGAVLGVATASFLVVVSLVVFPGLAEFDHDLGIRMRMYAQRVVHHSQGIEPGGSQWPASFVFVDVDLEPVPRAMRDIDASSACEAFDQARSRCTAPQALKAALLNDACAVMPATLNCSAARPLNRYLLAGLIEHLRKTEARLIVLDVELADEAGVVPPEENNALRAVLAKVGPTETRVVFAQPAQYDSQNEATGVHVVKLEPTYLAGPLGVGNGRGPSLVAVALPAPGQPVRRYPRCFRTSDPTLSPLPSLPYLAARLLESKGIDPKSLCVPRYDKDSSEVDPFAAPYIGYAFPALRAHEDDPLDDEDFEVWSTYRRVYNRCLAANVWSERSQCAVAEFYRSKVVVIGASNRLRRDRHATPLGNMAGAEVVINAINSFVVTPSPREKQPVEAIGKKIMIVLACLLPWFAYYALRGFLRRPPTDKDRRVLGKVVRAAMVFLAFWLTLGTVLGITSVSSYGSFSVLVGVLAIGIEQYVEVINQWVLQPSERGLKRAFGLPVKPDSH